MLLAMVECSQQKHEHAYFHILYVSENIIKFGISDNLIGETSVPHNFISTRMHELGLT